MIRFLILAIALAAPSGLFAQHVGIGTTAPVELLHVKDGHFRLEGNNRYLNFHTTFPFATGMRFYASGAFKGAWFFYSLSNQLNLSSLSSIHGLVYDLNDDKVFVGRDFDISGAEVFGVRKEVSSAAYGGIYAETNGHANAKPFYGYAMDGSAVAWHYYDGASSSWRLYNNGDRISVNNLGNVGIGTMIPENKLDIRNAGTADTSTIVLGLISDVSDRPVLQFSEFATATPGSGMSIEYDGVGNGSNNKLHFRGVDVVRKFTFTSGGDLGIGTESPNEMLEIAGNGRMFIGDGGGSNRSGLLIDADEAGDYVRIVPFDYGAGLNMDLYFPSNVNIGTAVGATGYKLSVDGKIMSEEIKVQMSGSWPDYVFADTYNLRPLDDIKQFVQTNHHLPGIPSASEVNKENGVELGEMQRLLLEKVEELTLYIIDQQEQINALQSELSVLKTK